MSNSIVQLLKNASRPFKEIEVTIGGNDFTMYARSLSQIETDEMSKTFSEEFDRVASEMEAGSVDTAMLRRSLSRQSKEKLAILIIRADHNDYLQEASSELDDKPFNDSKVVALAKEKEETAKQLLLQAPEEEVLDQAMERRAFVIAAIKATDAQNLAFVYYSLYHNGDAAEFERVFNSPHEVGELDRKDIAVIIDKIYQALRGGEKQADPLASPEPKRSRKRTQSVSN